MSQFATVQEKNAFLVEYCRKQGYDARIGEDGYLEILFTKEQTGRAYNTWFVVRPTFTDVRQALRYA